MSDVRRAVATHGETEGCEGERETGCFEQRVLSAWMPNYERSPSHLKFADVAGEEHRSEAANTPAWGMGDDANIAPRKAFSLQFSPAI